MFKSVIDFNSFIECVCAVQEVEHSAELSSNLYQRQLAAERRKTVGVLEENQTLQEALEDLTRKLRVGITSHQTPTKPAAERAAGSVFALLIFY